MSARRLAFGVASVFALASLAAYGCSSSSTPGASATTTPLVDSGCRPNLALACGFPSQGTTCFGAGSDPAAYGACAPFVLRDGGADANADVTDAGAGDYCCLNWSPGPCTPDLDAGCGAGDYGFACAAGHGPGEIDPSWSCAPGAAAGTMCCTYPSCAPDPSVSCSSALAGNTGWTCPYGTSPPSGSLTLCSTGEPSANGLTTAYCCFPLAPTASQAQAGCSAGGRGVCASVSDVVYAVACAGSQLPSSLGFAESACSEEAGTGVEANYAYYCCTALP